MSSPTPTPPGVILIADIFAENIFKGLMAREGNVRRWRVGDPSDADAAHDWTMLCSYMDEREAAAAAWNRRAENGKEQK